MPYADKSARNERLAKWRAANRDRLREYARDWREAHRPELVSYYTAYTRANPPPVEAIHAKKSVAAAVRSGRLVRQPCEICGDPRVQGHHAFGYQLRLAVWWLCELHHKGMHQLIRDGHRTAEAA